MSSRSKPLLPYLPEEIITEILSRLPVKTLIRFKSVSKSCLCLISNPEFINTHLVKSSHHTNHRLMILRIFSDQNYHYYLNSSSLHSIFYPPSDVHTNCVVELDYPLKDTHRCSPVQVVGSCNGLVCIAVGNKSIFIWNPSTRESKMLPNIRHGMLSMYGFGYDHLNDDYKLVWIVHHAKFGVSFENTVIVYSLKNNSWGKIRDFRHAISHHGAGKLVNGVLHWAVKSPSSYYEPNIFSLDLGNETYGEIAQPDCDFCGFDWSLSVLNGWLCVCYNFDVICADVWVMKEYGVRDSWVKFCTIPYSTGLKNFGFYCSDSPLCLSMTGEVLLEDTEEGLVLYDPNSGTLRNPQIPNLLTSVLGLKVTTYLESLVSPGIFDELRSPQQ